MKTRTTTRRTFVGVSVIAQPRHHLATLIRLAFSAFAVFAAASVQAAQTWYVDAETGSDANDGLSWGTAKASIQAGIDMAFGNDIVLVADGVYDPVSTSRKGFGDTITIRSVNGAEKTIIDGGGVCDCAYLRNNASSTWDYSTIEGFTLRNGHIGIYFGNAVNCIIINNDSSKVYRYSEGGGAKYASLKNCEVANNTAGYHGGGMYGGSSEGCLFHDNYSKDDGGGAYSGTHSNSVFRGNSAAGWGGAVANSTTVDCTFQNNSAKNGGAKYAGSSTRCLFVGNSASVNGGATYSGSCYDCVFNGNSSTSSGGASSAGTFDRCVFSNNTARSGAGVGKSGTFYNCLLVNNTSKGGSGAVESAKMVNCTICGNKGTTVGGALSSTLENCIAWNNIGGNVSSCTNTYSCISPLQDGEGNISDNPMLAGVLSGDYSLGESSPCIDAGTENLLPTTKDLAKNPRVRNGVVDMGAYELQSGSEYSGPVTWYVDASAKDGGDGKSWETAFQEIQDAVDAATGEDSIVVGRGRYRPIWTDGKILTIESASGEKETFIDASLMWEEGITNRCASLDYDGSRTNSHSHVVNDPAININTKLRGFTLVNGVAEYAGGVFSGLIEHCIISNCMAKGNGGGAYVSQMNDCKILLNRAENGGGAYLCSLNRCLVQGNCANENGGGGVFGKFINTVVIGNMANGEGGGIDMTEPINCTIVGNMAASGGGGHEIMQCENSIVWGNTLLDGVTIENYNPEEYGFWGMNCCTWPEPEGYDNVSTDPLITWAEDGMYTLDSRSPCIDRGDNYVVEEDFYGIGDTDYAGNVRVQGGGVDIGAIEMSAGILTSVEIDVVVDGCGQVSGAGRYEVGDAAIIKATETDGIHFFEGFFINGVEITTDVTHRGVEHILEHCVDGAATIVAKFRATTFFVSQTGNDSNIGTTKETARRTIQSAVNSSGNGDTIIVDDGVYDSFKVEKKGASLEMRSVNGCDYTFIDGQSTGRCVYVSCDNFKMTGFTIRNGNYRGSGGGIYGANALECWDSVIKNCNASESGGGVSYGTLYNCRIESNTSHLYGGGCQSCILYNCIVVNNRVLTGGGIYQNGGGVYYGEAYNCTIYGNYSAQKGGGAYHTDLCNCIILGNRAPTGPQVENRPYEGGWYYATNCFSSVALHGKGNIVGSDALFANAGSGDFSLLEGSPCIDAGENGWAFLEVDILGNERVSNGRIDIGAVELQQIAVPVEDYSFGNIWGGWSVEGGGVYEMPEYANSWEALAHIAWRSRDALAQSGRGYVVPPTSGFVILALGAIAVPDNLVPCDAGYETEMENDVAVWRLRIVEDTNTCSLVGCIGNQFFNLSTIPAYAGRLWTKSVYGNPPEYLTQSELEEWYAKRSRDRVAWLVTLVPNSRWADYCENRSVAADEAEDAGEPPLLIDAFKVDAQTAIHGVSVRSLSRGKTYILGRETLSLDKWDVMGIALQPRGTATTGAFSETASQFIKAVFTVEQADSDGDGIEDVIETTVFGTSPYRVDTSGDGLTDWAKIFRYGLNPTVPDTDGDGMTDDEEIIYQSNPTIPFDNTVQDSLNVSMRYYYDDDGRLIGTYFGKGGGKSRTELSLVGNPEAIESKGE